MHDPTMHAAPPQAPADTDDLEKAGTTSSCFLLVFFMPVKLVVFPPFFSLFLQPGQLCIGDACMKHCDGCPLVFMVSMHVQVTMKNVLEGWVPLAIRRATHQKLLASCMIRMHLHPAQSASPEKEHTTSKPTSQHTSLSDNRTIL